jgi:hypothetical protein
MKMNFQNEILLINEARSILTSYDDFILGLKMTKILYDEHKKALTDFFNQKLKLVYDIAAKQGVDLQLPNETAVLEFKREVIL